MANHKDQSGKILQQMELGLTEKPEMPFVQRELKCALDHMKTAYEHVTYLASKEGEKSSGTRTNDKTDGKTLQVQPELKDEETDIDVRLKALFAKADELKAQNTRMVKIIELLRVQSEILLKKRDEIKAQAQAQAPDA